jgi:uncharacterized membrane protein (DUF485 family)
LSPNGGATSRAVKNVVEPVDSKALPRARAFATRARMTTQSPGPPRSSAPDIHSESFLHSLMARQLKLSIACALAFLVALLGLPLANYFWPGLMATRVFGFTLTWFVLGVLFFPFVWIISYAFIRRSIALENAEVKEVAREVTKEAKP